MPPTDSTPNINTGNFQLLYSLQACNKIPISEYKSKESGLTVVVAEVDGPIVNGYFCLATEALDDDGLPHTLEHLIFLGSEQFPYKGVLDILANRCLASGTNAFTTTDHTCYTMETAGYEGFLTLMPIYLDHILFPILSDEGFVTEVHHVTARGEDAGVVYCEMQGCENAADNKIYLAMARALYPGKCGYSSQTGGIMKNLRESCDNTKVRNYHKEFYRPENLKIIITGQVKPEDVFKVLAPLEAKIISKGERGAFTRPWQDPIPPIPKSDDLILKYPDDDDNNNGIFRFSFRGPSTVNDEYTVNGLSILLKYLTDLSVSPLQKEFIEIDDPYASQVAYYFDENPESEFHLNFQNVPIKKLPQMKPKLIDVLSKIVEKSDIDMERLINTINRLKLETLSHLENSPHEFISTLIIKHMLYGNTKEDLEKRVNPLVDLQQLQKEPKQYWLDLLDKYFFRNKTMSLQGIPSVEEKEKLATDEKERVAVQIAELGEHGLKQKEKELEDAITYNERPPPESMITSVPIPGLDSIKFHDIIRHRTDSDERHYVDLSQTNVFTYFDHVKTEFVHMCALMNTTSLPSELRLYLPLLLETIFESPIRRGNVLVPYEEVVKELSNDTVSSSWDVGLEVSSRFTCGKFCNLAKICLQLETARYDKGIKWLRELLYHTVLTPERLKIIATKIVNDVSEVKRNPSCILRYIMRGLLFAEDSNIRANGILKQHKFLVGLLEKLESAPKEVLASMETLRKSIVDPSNIVLYFAGNLNDLKNATESVNNFLPSQTENKSIPRSLEVEPDWKLLMPSPKESCIVGMGCLESSYLYQTIPSITNVTDPDKPAVLLFMQYFTQAEGPMWKQIRGKGYAYGYRMNLVVEQGFLYLILTKSTNIVAAYDAARTLVSQQITDKEWNETLLESARKSLIFEVIEDEKTIGNVISLSLNSYFHNVDYKYNRNLLSLIEKVTIEDLNRVGVKYIEPLFDATKNITAVVCHPSKADEIKIGLEQYGLKLNVYPSLEESFLNK